MGQALARGWCSAHLPADALITLDRNPDKRADFYREVPCATVNTLDALAQHTPTAICLAVKPHQLDELLPQIKRAFTQNAPLLLTVIAGKNTAYYAGHLWENAAIIRLMPNTPSQVRAGMSGCFANNLVSATQRQSVDTLMQSVGQTLWLNDEAQMHALTAISGSGPAYVFYLMQCFLRAAQAQGFDAMQARQLVSQTFLGAAQMAGQSELSIEALRQNVTSPNGTTQAGLDALMDDELMQRIMRTVEAAKSRSETLMTP